LIENQNDWEACSEAANATEAVQAQRRPKPHLTVVEFNIFGLDGLKASHQMLNKEPRPQIPMDAVFTGRQGKVRSLKIKSGAN
jgi:CheY-like chemotaxis protein